MQSSTAGRRLALRLEAGEQHHHGAWLRPVAMAGNRGRSLPVDDILWGIEEGVDPSAPWISSAVGAEGSSNSSGSQYALRIT